jgi:hypothetical protein
MSELQRDPRRDPRRDPAADGASFVALQNLVEQCCTSFLRSPVRIARTALTVFA